MKCHFIPFFFFFFVGLWELISLTNKALAVFIRDIQQRDIRLSD